MHQLRLLGTATIEGPAVEPVGVPKGARLALLALLVAHEGRGVGRERVMALLWPESSPERARHLLRDTLYRLRDIVGADAITANGDVLALNQDRVQCDVWQFDAAVRAGRWFEADALYAGPFLDALFPSESPPFEQWLDSEKARLRRLQVHCLEAIADHHETKNAFVEATEAWRRLTTIDPYNGRYATGLMQALDAIGDRAGALQHAAAHTAMLSNELSASPDPGVLALAELLRHNPPAHNAPEPVAEDVASEHLPYGLSRAQRPHVVPARRRWRLAAFVALAPVLLWFLVGRTLSRLGSPPDASFYGQPLGTSDASAQDQYRRGLYHLARRGASNLQSALTEFQSAIQRDPQFARAHAGVSAAATLLTLYDGKGFGRDSMLPLALMAAERAVGLDDSLSEGFAALGQVLTYLGRRTEAEKAYQRAIDLDPNSATVRQWFAELLLASGRVDGAISQMETAIRIDPQSAINHGVAANHYRIAGRFDEALRMGERAVQLDPTMPAVWEFYARALFDAGRRDSAERLFARHSPQSSFHAYVRVKNGDRGVRDSLQGVVENWVEGALPRNGTVALAVVSLAAENLAAAVEVLERAQEANPAFPLHNTLIDQIYDPIRRAPRFREIVRRAGLDVEVHLQPRRAGTLASAPR